MSTIGGRTVNNFNGFMWAGALQAQTEIFGREGVDGDGMHTLAKRGETIEVTTSVDVASSALADTEIAAYIAMAGTTVTVVDQFSTSWTSTKVESVVAIPSKTLTSYRVLATWKFRPAL